MRSIYKTDMSFGQLDISISVYSAVESKTGLNQISKCCGTRVSYKKICNGCNKELTQADLDKGYPLSKDDFVVIKNEELDTIFKEKSNINILGFCNISHSILLTISV